MALDGFLRGLVRGVLEVPAACYGVAVGSLWTHMVA